MCSYEQHCDDYMMFGDPARDAADYELAAQYDRFDGLRGDFDSDDYAWEREYEDWCAYQDRIGWEESFSRTDNEDHADWLDCMGLYD